MGAGAGGGHPEAGGGRGVVHMDLPGAPSVSTCGFGIQNNFSFQTEMSLLKELREGGKRKKKLWKILKENVKEEMKTFSKCLQQEEGALEGSWFGSRVRS